MLCRVCKRELTNGPVCGFCGEDNTVYIENAKAEEARKAEEIPSIYLDEGTNGKKKSRAKTADNTKDRYKVKSKYTYDTKKLIRSLVFLAVIVIVIIGLIMIIVPDKKEEPKSAGESLFTSGMLAVASNGEWGYVNIEDPSIFAIAPQFSHITNYYGERAAVCIDGKFALIDKEGNLISEPKFEAVGKGASNGLIPAKSDGKWGYIGEDAEFVIEPKFIFAREFGENGMALVSVSGGYGYIGEDGEYIIAPQYDMALPFGTDGMAAVKTGEKWGYIDEDGNAVIEPRFDEAYSFDSGYAVIKQYGAYGLISAEGLTVIEPQFDSRFYLDGEYAVVEVGGKFGMINKDGSYVINPRFLDLGSFGSEELAYAQRGDGKYGFVDKNGEFKISPQYEECKSFNSGLAPVKKDGLWGYIDKDGNEIIDNKYLFASEFYSDGYAYVTAVDGSVTVIDASGATAMLNSASSIDKLLK